ncbi:MAG: tyrosine-type recombinase/integrase, partial [Clostridiales bacterium]|nr:tyrosine-type recombinase/integrase [Clostridiales bacterium]
SDYIISTPKTKSSVRSVHLPQSVLNILGEYRKTVNSEWVCPSPLDPTHPRSPTSCRSRLSDMLERAECNHIPFHGLRHIFSTMALENGLEIKTLSAVLGHSSAETTISVYSHVTGEMERNAAKKMDDAFGTPKPADSPVCDDNPDDGQTPEQEPKRAEFTACDDNPDDGQTPEQEPKHAEFTAKKSKKRKPGTGCISKVSKNTWQGKYTPRSKDGKREQYIVYAKSEEKCERKLGEMIKELKNEAVIQ